MSKVALASLGNGRSYLIQQLDLNSYQRCRAAVVRDPFVTKDGLDQRRCWRG